MLSVKEIVKELKVFERNKVSLEIIKILGIVTYIQTSSVRRIARILSELHPISKSSVHRWIKKFEERLPITTDKKQRNLIAIDETVVKANKKQYYVYTAIDVERNELILTRVYTTRNINYEVLHQCLNTVRISLNSLLIKLWLIDALKNLGLEYEHQIFR